MPKESAGILMFRQSEGAVEVLLVHPGGPFWAKKDWGAWSIPKGELGIAEDPLPAARREFEEELGTAVTGEFIALKPIRQAGGKWVRAWAVLGDLDPDSIESNMFEMEWPPRSGRIRAFPEVDRAGWFPLEAAREKIVAGQVGLLEQLDALLRSRLSESSRRPD